MRAASENARILVVDDSANTREVIQRNLSAEGYQVLTAPGVPEAIALLESVPVDLVITDLKMPKASGLDLVQHVRENCKGTGVMMITGYPTIRGAVDAIQTGAEEFLPKPFTDAELTLAVRKTLEQAKRRRVKVSVPEPAAPE